MSYLKLIACAGWAGLYASILIALLIFHLDIDLAHRGIISWNFLGIFLSLAVVYVPLVAVLLPTLFLFVRFFAVRRLTAHWFSLKASVWFCVVTLGGMTLLYYHNLWWTTSLVPPGNKEVLRLLSALMGACCLSSLACMIMGQFRPEGPKAVFWRMTAAMILFPPVVVAVLLAPVASVDEADRRPQWPEAAPVSVSDGSPVSLLMVGIDAASMDQVLPMIASRELPVFEQLMRLGTWTRLNSLRPCESPVAWTTLLTGSHPWESRIMGSSTWSLPLGPDQLRVIPLGLGFGPLVTSGFMQKHDDGLVGRRTLLLGEILELTGVRVYSIGFADADPIPGAPAQDNRAAGEVRRILGSSQGVPPPGTLSLMQLLQASVKADLDRVEGALSVMRARGGPPGGALLVRLPGLARVSRRFLRFRTPEAFGDVRPEEAAFYSGVIPGYYRFLDRLLGEMIQAAPEDSLVAVVSPYGVEQAPSLEWMGRRYFPGDADGDEAAPVSGSWWRGPDGILLLAGGGVDEQAHMGEADLVDVVPTLLYALGHPIGRDMRGDLLRRLFRTDFQETHTVRFVPGYPLHPDYEAE